MQRVLLFSLLSGAPFACGEGTGAATPGLDGEWLVSFSTVTNDCTSGTSLFPLRAGPVQIATTPDAATIANSGGEPRHFRTESRGWLRQRREVTSDCRASLTERWTWLEIGRIRFSALHEMRLETVGACETLPMDACRQQTSVRGVRP